MTKKIGDKKIDKVKSTTETSGVQGTEAITGVHKVRPASAVGGIKGAGRIGQRRPTRIMSMEEREQLFRMIGEEAEKLADEGVITPVLKETVTKAVKMAVDAGLLEKEKDQK